MVLRKYYLAASTYSVYLLTTVLHTNQFLSRKLKIEFLVDKPFGLHTELKIHLLICFIL